MAYIPDSSSVVAFQSDPSKFQASITGTVTVRNGSSVSGQLGASVIGTVPVTQAGAWFVSGSVATVVANQSVSGTVGASIIGLTPVNIVGAPSIYGNISGSVAAFQGGAWSTSVVGTVGASIIGTVPVVQSGVQVTSIVSSIPSSVLVGASIFGQLPAGTAVLGSVAALQGTNPWVVNFSNSSIIAINAGSVVAIPSGSVISVLQAPSIVGTYAEDAASASGDKGLFMLGVRNDTMASVTSADVDYSTISTGPVGETIVANSPITKWISGTASTVSGSAAVASVALIAAQGASIFSYITSAQVANTGPSTALITFTTGGSILGYAPAPTGGGAILNMPNGLKSRPNASIDISSSAASSVISVSAQGFISKT